MNAQNPVKLGISNEQYAVSILIAINHSTLVIALV